MKINKLLIANRGEIAVRIIRAARELGIETVLVHSVVDSSSLAAQLADEVVELQSAMGVKSYLDIDAIVQVAIDTDTDAVHPGYGFLAENADFADAVESAGKIFVGPSGDTIRLMGEKSVARAEAKRLGVPVVPGSDGAVGDLEDARKIAGEIGLPVMIKASGGGGGRGIRIVRQNDEFDHLISQATSEAQAAFGNREVYIEKVVECARHIEVQILGDGNNYIHCFERECSLQRRRQKIWEEAPSQALSADVREQLCRSAVDLARHVNYRGAGTVEFIYNDDTEEYFFIEMNTRIQVEHPVTEWIVGIDLVAEMIRIAGGIPLSIRQSDLVINGHSIEVRINAEDPGNNFMPSPGAITGLRLPDGPGVRLDHMLYQGYEVPPFYDSLLGKLTVWADSREHALARLKRAVSELRIEGLNTTIPLFLALANDRNVKSNDVHTQWLEPWLMEHAGGLKTQA